MSKEESFLKSPQIYTFVLPIIEEIKSLQSGGSLLFKAKDKTHATRVRNALYRYLRIHNLKSQYRIYLEQSKFLRIVHLYTEAPILIGKNLPSKAQEYVRNNLIMCKNEEEAILKMREDLENSTISDEDIVSILEEFNLYKREEDKI